jgi:hypothetical protein
MVERSKPQKSPETIQPHTVEHGPLSPERTQEALAETVERQQERIETARKDIEQTESHTDRESVRAQHDSAEQTVRITSHDKRHAYRSTLSRVQSQLSPAKKRISKAIHNPVVERVSETAEKTVARPSGILGGGIVATIGLAVMNYYANRNGFRLSGSELIIFVGLGYISGVAIEYLIRLVKKH